MKVPHFYWCGKVDYATGLAMQDTAVQQVREGSSPGCIFLLEHHPVYTIGRTRDQSSLRDPRLLPYPVQEINRGGQATYHGPGQLVGYPILDLTPYGRDLHRYLRFLENFVLHLSARYGVQAERREGLTGAWVKERKLASIGVGVRHWISMHGFGLNVTPEALKGFAHITPCGLGGVSMTDLSSESGHLLNVEGVAEEAGSLFLQELEALRVS